MEQAAPQTRKKSDGLIKWVLAGVGGLLLWNLYSHGAAALSLNFLPGRIKKLSWDGQGPSLQIELQAQNTSNHSFNVLSIAGQVYVTQNGQDYLIGRVSDFTPVAVAPNSVSLIPLTISMQLTGVVQNLINIFQTGINTQNIKLQAFANVDALQVPLNYSYNL